ncbi:branched-chain amino acid ABC transporter permease [Acidimicrobiales bacterium]|nr:branched-chain amino acid ABC transporter permease [Acidimicrobiales bacterium]MDC1390346.1 branched-chain amino acid ABC transporter permease [Acidimicrobiales bacterium]MDG1086403.1 branched-chain amino acid ABC transporter permease [Acidimicrobiales bacterium]
MLSPRIVRWKMFIFLCALIFSVAGAFIMPVAQAQETAPDHEIRGTLRVGRDPVPDISVTVFDEAGAEVGTSISDEGGQWQIEITSTGEYTAVIDVATLPEGVGFKEGATNEVVKEVLALDKSSYPVAFKLEDGAAPLIAPVSTATQLANRAVSGLRVGLLVALAAVGLSLIYGVTGLVNFAHSEMVTFGAVTAFGFEALMPSLPFVIPVILGIMSGGLLGFVLERGLFKPLRDRKMNNISLMVVSIGLAFVLRYVIVIYFRAEPVGFKHYLLQTGIDIGPIKIPVKDIVIMSIAFFMLILIATLLQKTRLGTSMRAVSDNPALAESSGIDINKTILAVWVAGSALAAMGGIFLGLTNIIEWQMGEKMLLLIFAAVTLGGLGTAYGAMVGGLAIGFVSEMSTFWLDNDLKFLIALVVLIIILLVRPQGILGVRERLG